MPAYKARHHGRPPGRLIADPGTPPINGPDALDAAVRQSQRRHLLVQRVHGAGRATVRDFKAGGGTEGRWCRGRSGYNHWAFDLQ